MTTLIEPLRPRPLRAAIAAAVNVPEDRLNDRDISALRKSISRAIHAYQVAADAETTALAERSRTP